MVGGDRNVSRKIYIFFHSRESVILYDGSHVSFHDHA